MTSRKRKIDEIGELRSLFESISELCLSIKPKLASLSSLTTDDQASFPRRLDRLASAAETFTAIRTRSATDNGEDIRGLTNTLDQEGVNFWNVSGLIRRDKLLEVEEDRQLFASLRLAGFRLIEAGMEEKPGMESIIHVLQIASKAGIALSDAGQKEVASSVMICAAAYEERLRDLQNSEGASVIMTLDSSKDRAIVLYYCGRMVSAWNEGNHGVAEYMLDKIEADKASLKELSSYDREALAVRTFTIGKNILRSSARPTDDSSAYTADQTSAQSAIKWLQRSFAFVEEHAEADAIDVLKREILRTLARAYFMVSSSDPDNLSRAETTLNELMTLLEARPDVKNQEMQQCLWMKLAILKKRNALEGDLLDTFSSIAEYSDFSETGVTDILQELRTMSHHPTLLTSVLRKCLQQILINATDDKGAAVDRLVLTLLFHCSKDSDLDRAMSTARAGCTLLTDHNYDLEQTPATACVTILWQVGDRHYHRRQWARASDWFLLATHDAFGSIAGISQAKCFRKAALSYIELKEYASASTMIGRCPSGNASTCYLLFLAAMQQGIEERAIEALHKLVKAHDFQKKMLLLAIRLAHEANNRAVLLASLNTLLMMLRDDNDPSAASESILLIRCIVRLLLTLCKEATDQDDRLAFMTSIINHLRSAVQIVSDGPSEIDLSSISKDISWMWRTAYNSAVQACAEWDSADELICDLFELSSLLLQAYARICITGVDSDTRARMAYASFACVAGRTFRLRQSAPGQHTYSEILFQIDRTQTLIVQLKKGQPCTEQVGETLDKIAYALRLFEVEICCLLKDWDRVQAIVADMYNVPLSTFEAIVGLLWSEESCPLHVLYAALEAILHSCLRCNAMGVEAFSRWLRATCTILLARNRTEDRKKAISYIEQALTVIQETEQEPGNTQGFPVDERQWLLSTTYNTGLECLTGNCTNTAESKRWLEAAIVICRYIPDAQGFVNQVSELFERAVQYDSRGDKK